MRKNFDSRLESTSDASSPAWPPLNRIGPRVQAPYDHEQSARPTIMAVRNTLRRFSIGSFVSCGLSSVGRGSIVGPGTKPRNIHPRPYTKAPPKRTIIQLVGTDRPSRRQAEAAIYRIHEELGRGEAMCFPFYADETVSTPAGWYFVTPPSVPGAIKFLMRTLAKVPRVITRSLPRREP